MTNTTPLILVTNDDGVRSTGLAAAVEALDGLGELLIVAPAGQQTSSGRSYPRTSTGAVSEQTITVGGRQHRAYAVDGTPAQAVILGLHRLAPRRPSLLVAGINYGENLGSGVTVSGTIGACLEGAASFVLGLAVSIETAMEHHYNPVDGVDFTVARRWARYFADRILSRGLPTVVDILKVDVPASATLQTPWRLTRLSRQRYYHPLFEQGTEPTDVSTVGYTIQVDRDGLESDSDIHAFLVDRVVSVTPMTADLTAQVEWDDLSAQPGTLFGGRAK